MCGILGIALNKNSTLIRPKTGRLLDDLFRLSESRGQEASGVSLLLPDEIYVTKIPSRASNLLRQNEYKMIRESFSCGGKISTLNRQSSFNAIIGHSRLVTNGSHDSCDNNQPVIADGMVVVHNGIITNEQQLWSRFPELKREYEVDTEIIPRLIHKFFREENSLILAVQKTFNLIEGVASIAVIFDKFNYLLLATNNGSLYCYIDKENGLFIFASERYILETALKQRHLKGLFIGKNISHCIPGFGYLLDLESHGLNEFQLELGLKSSDINSFSLIPQRKITNISNSRKFCKVTGGLPQNRHFTATPFLNDSYNANKKIIDSLRRCTRCILPESMPGISFDDKGVCNYCNSYIKIAPRGKEALEKFIASCRNKPGEPDCLVAFSGGRDSSYGVHYLKTVLKMNPVTFTYDWGMVTDLGRRNQMRICGKLGIENILISADIAKKRRNIQKNVLAWLKRPRLGTVPLFMSGDKQFFYHANKIRSHIKVKLVFFCVNLLESTKFKSAFCGVTAKNVAYNMSFYDKAKLFAYYSKECIANPYYVNSSIFDTIFAYCSYYVLPSGFPNVYDFIEWDEKEIESTLINKYNWEVASDTKSTWRIGDGTAPFYNYIYYTMAGFTENDTFRSNQIREGTLLRKEALELVERENEPRYESIRWYCDTIGIDTEKALMRINTASKLYDKVAR